MKKNRSRGLLALVSLSGLMAAAAPAAAQEGVALQQFHPTPMQRTGLLSTSAAETLLPGLFEVHLLVDYASSPLVVRDLNNERLGTLVGSMATLHLLGGLGLLGFFDVGFDVPAVAVLAGSAPAGSPGLLAESDLGLGDIRLVPRLRLSRNREAGDSGVSLALIGNFWLPTGDADAYNGGSFRAEPRLAVDYQNTHDVRIAFNAGYLIQPKGVVANLTTAGALTYSAGIDLPIVGSFRVVSEIFGSAVIAAGDVSAEELPLEFLVAGRLVPDNFTAQLGGGFGVISGYGAPDFRVLASFGLTPQRNPDRDGDGILKADDECPSVAEDQDGFQDADGCPEHDNDADGIADLADACPDAPEDLDGFQDEDGCPDPDNEADADTDADGIMDSADACVSEAEDVDGVEDEDGCPEPAVEVVVEVEEEVAVEVEVDSDGDGILDSADACVPEPEDVDGFEDEDGCPDPDNDGDGVADLEDACPLEAEVVNGIDDADGCPDDGETLVQVTSTNIRILETLFFETNSDVIQSRSFDVLEQVAAVLRSTPRIRLVEVQGHTDSTGAGVANLDLSQRRAASVVRFLVERGGIEPSRLRALGYGEELPIGDNNTPAGRDANRRVEFVIIEQ